MAALDYAFLPMGLIFVQIAYYSVGLFNALWCLADLTLRISWQSAIHWMLVFLWVFLCGLTHYVASRRGMYEQRFPMCRLLASGAFRLFCIWGDALHHCRDCDVSFLHAISSLAMSYSHHMVKEGTSPPIADVRIRNIVMIPSKQAFPRARHICLHLSCLLDFDCGVGLCGCAVGPTYEFDTTLGYPGEGPRWAIISANIDSFATNDNCLHWEADVLALQEARVAESNLVESQRKAALCHLQLFCSQPLQKIRASNGTYRIPSGGTATLGQKEFTQLFDDQADQSGQWTMLRSTTRVTATWHQVAEGVKLLIFNFYAIANAASERAKFARNNELLNSIFEVAAQFGDAPIVVAGDFQMEPGMYPAVQLALDHWGWADPLLQTDTDGDVTRPCTFFQNVATGDSDGQSSIDGILMNRTALTALLHIEVLDHQDRQHRPVKATFMWDKLLQSGTIMQRPAVLNLDNVQHADPTDPGCPVNSFSEQLWHHYAQQFYQAADADTKWVIYNEYAAKLLVLNGAVWGKGSRCRGAHPKFVKVQASASQEANGNLASPHLLSLQSIVRSLRELEARFNRATSGPGDLRTFRNTQHRLLRKLKVAKLLPFSVRQIFAHDVPHLIEITLKAIRTEMKQLKLAAIRRWRTAMKFATSSPTIGKIVYQYLKKKGRVAPPNLVEDDNGNIIYDPQKAMDFIADKWDSVFAVNAEHTYEMQILKQVWPYIHDKGRSVVLPPITEDQLWRQAAKRRADAAAGLDAWQTREVRALPPAAFRPVAVLFNAIEAGALEFPQILTQVRTVIHNKDGSDAPLSKRLISLQSVFTLLYTGLRFGQLQEWQQDIMPPQLKGGIKGRLMSEVHMTMQLEIDRAHAFQGSFAALKLDKAKCFDRLMPRLCAAIMLALGLPKNFVCGFLALYTRMTRFLSFKQWTRKQAISTPNGVVQGCSLSLLCINIHVAIWAWIICNIDGVDFRAFIDDTYLWTRLPSIANLVAAVRATELWDSLCGQFLNAGKCEIFATTADLRKALKTALPQMRLVEVVNILGAHVQTTRKNVGSFPLTKLQAALRDCEAIRALPCDAYYKREQILTTKVLPQVAFAPQLNFLPKRLLARLQCAIADAIWQDRPKWRSKHLLLCVVHKAHKLDPFLFRAVTTIIESARFLRTSHFARQSRQAIYEQDQFTPQSWMMQFSQACHALDIEWCSPFGFSLLQAPEVSFLEFSLTDLKCILKSVAAHKCYCVASLMPRKDIHKAQKMLAVPNDNFSFSFHWESAITGCTLRADRLAASGLIDSAQCRFCGGAKESLCHFVEECTALPEDLRQPSTRFFFGPNFDQLGIVETPVEDRAKLRVSQPSDLAVYAWGAPVPNVQHVWTDGSVQLASHPWLTLASFAVVGDDEQLLSAGLVRHWRLSSYSAELWAILAAFAGAKGPLVIHTDSQTVVNQFNELLRVGVVRILTGPIPTGGDFCTTLSIREVA